MMIFNRLNLYVIKSPSIFEVLQRSANLKIGCSIRSLRVYTKQTLSPLFIPSVLRRRRLSFSKYTCGQTGFKLGGGLEDQHLDEIEIKFRRI